jgi:Ca2+-binding RTX toxin-like protein
MNVKSFLAIGGLAITMAIPMLSTAVPSALALQPRCLGEPATIVLLEGQGTVNGTDDRDVVVGSPGPDRFNGNGGDDVICLGAGDDYAHGGLGNDQIYGDDGNDILYGSFDNDRVVGGKGNDTLSGDSSNDVCIGGKGKKDKALKSLVTGGCEKKKTIEKTAP